MILSKKQISAVKKAKKLISEANSLLKSNLSHLDYDVVIAQTLSRVNAADFNIDNIVEPNN